MSKLRDFEFRGHPNVYINREIQEVPVFNLRKFMLGLTKRKIATMAVANYACFETSSEMNEGANFQ